MQIVSKLMQPRLHRRDTRTPRPAVWPIGGSRFVAFRPWRADEDRPVTPEHSSCPTGASSEQDREVLREPIEAGRVSAVIDGTLPLSEVAQGLDIWWRATAAPRSSSHSATVGTDLRRPMERIPKLGAEWFREAARQNAVV